MFKLLRDFIFSFSIATIIFSSPFAILNKVNHKITNQVEIYFINNPEIANNVDYKVYLNNMKLTLNDYFEFSYSDSIQFNENYLKLDKIVYDLTDSRILNNNISDTLFFDSFEKKIEKSRKNIFNLYLFSLLFFILSPLIYILVGIFSRNNIKNSFEQSIKKITSINSKKS